MSVGRSAVRCISSAQTIASSYKHARILDFGCGHGRVMRHLRAFAPQSELYAADIRADGVQFCVDEFGCEPVLLTQEFCGVQLPGKQDIIFVGSVFTHIDYQRQKKLWKWLFDALAPSGLLVATFHGYRAREFHESGAMKFISDEKWALIISEYEKTGCGYQSYEIADLGDWGVSLNAVPSIFGLPGGHKENRVVGFAEYGWAGIQDAVCWQRI